jgi:Tol biopolymer transport system component
VDWSPDGKHILTKLGRPVLIALADGSVQDLAIENPEMMCFSPDGRYIAYDAVQAKEARQHDVYVYERATQRTVPLVRHPADDRLAGWAPDGRYVLFASNRRGAVDALLVAVSNGQPQGEPVLVRKDLGASSGIGFARSGAYYFAVSAGGHDIHTARLDPETGTLLSPSAEAAGSYLGSNWGPDFSRDGRFLAYVSVRGTGAEREGVIVIRSLETEKERLLRPALAPTEIGHGLCWAPDGRSLFVDGADKTGRGGLFRIDAQTGEASFILEQRFVRDVLHLEPSPDGRSLYYTARAEDGQRGFRVMVCDLGSGKVQLLNRSTQMALALSPDGRQLAFFAAAGQGEAEGLVVMPSAGGSARLVARGADGLTIAWSPDGRYLIYPVRMKTSGANLEQRRNELWRVPAQGGDPQRLNLTVDGLLRRLRVHPDGQRIVYYARLLGSDVWVMENFLPGTK